MLKAIYLLLFLGLLQLQLECARAPLVVPNVQKTAQPSLEMLQELYFSYLIVLETSLAKENDPQLYESGLQFLAALDKRIEDLKKNSQVKVRNYWHSRHGRK